VCSRNCFNGSLGIDNAVASAKGFPISIGFLSRGKGYNKAEHSTVQKNKTLTATVVESSLYPFGWERVRHTSAFELPEVDE
jgi:hypothetical protein